MSSLLDRRTFLSGAGAAVALGTTAPAVLSAMPSLVPTSQTTALGRWSDWHVDDMWNHPPRATARIGLGRRAGRCRIEVAAIDRQFCS